MVLAPEGRRLLRIEARNSQVPIERKPEWIKTRLRTGPEYTALKELVRETTDVIERMCIEAALKLTGDNRATAAEMLGLSRQSLYVKLRRFGLAEPSEYDENKVD